MSGICGCLNFLVNALCAALLIMAYSGGQRDLAIDSAGVKLGFDSLKEKQR